MAEFPWPSSLAAGPCVTAGSLSLKQVCLALELAAAGGLRSLGEVLVAVVAVVNGVVVVVLLAGAVLVSVLVLAEECCRETLSVIPLSYL